MKQRPATSSPSQPQPAPAPVPDMDGEFRRIGAGDEVGRAHQIQKFVFREPTAMADHFVFHHGDVRSRSAEGREAQTKEQPGQFGQVGTHVSWV